MRPAHEKCGVEFIPADGTASFVCNRREGGWLPDIHRGGCTWFFRVPIIGGTYYYPPHDKTARSHHLPEPEADR